MDGNNLGGVGNTGKILATVGYEALYEKTLSQPISYRGAGTVSQPQSWFSYRGITVIRQRQPDNGASRQ